MISNRPRRGSGNARRPGSRMGAFPWCRGVLSAGAILTALSVATWAVEPAERALAAQRELERTLYEGMFNPDFEGEVRFISAVPLISRAPDTRPASQYYTALLMQAEHSIESLFYTRVQQLFSEAVAADPQVGTMRKGFRLAAAGRVLKAVFGEREWLSAFRPAGEEEEHAEAPRQAAAEGESEHVHADGVAAHDASAELPAVVPTSTDPCRAMLPLPAGFQASATEATTGLACLKRVDEALWKNGRADLNQILPMEAVEWRIYDRRPAPQAQYERFISRGVPFVVHRGELDYLICGLAKHADRTYLMGYDLAAIERRVSLSSSGASVTYSEYVRLADEKRAQGKDPLVEFDPLFWDYKSYFSVKNLGSFRLVPADGPETVTALYPMSLKEDQVRTIIAGELETAKEQQAEWARRKQTEKQANADRWLEKAREQQAAAEKEADQ